MHAPNHHHRHVAVRNVTLISAAANAGLGVFKIGVGIIGFSHALFADGIHSLADLLTDALVLFASKAAHKNPDSEHPYGHGRIETLATTAVATMLVMVGLTLAYNVIVHALTAPIAETPTPAVFIVAVVSVVVNEVFFQYSFLVGKRIKSALVVSNAWHHRSDGLVSVIVLVGLIGVHFGYHYWDVAGAVIIAGLIVKMGLKMIWESVSELIDTGVDAETLEKIRAIILGVSGVMTVHQLRTRSLGGEIFVDVHVLVNPSISVSEGHYISDRVWFALRQQVDNISDVVVHIDPEDDEITPPSSHLMGRKELEFALKKAWADIPAARHLRHLVLHYSAGFVNVDVYLPVSFASESQALKELLEKEARTVAGVGTVQVFFY